MPLRHVSLVRGGGKFVITCFAAEADATTAMCRRMAAARPCGRGWQTTLEATTQTHGAGKVACGWRLRWSPMPQGDKRRRRRLVDQPLRSPWLEQNGPTEQVRVLVAQVEAANNNLPLC